MGFLGEGKSCFSIYMLVLYRERTNFFFQRGVFLLSPKRGEGEKRDRNIVFCFEMWGKASGHLSSHQ